MIIYEEELHAEAVKRNGSSQEARIYAIFISRTITFMDVTGRALRIKTADVIKVIFNSYLQER